MVERKLPITPVYSIAPPDAFVVSIPNELPGLQLTWFASPWPPRPAIRLPIVPPTAALVLSDHSPLPFELTDNVPPLFTVTSPVAGIETVWPNCSVPALMLVPPL